MLILNLKGAPVSELVTQYRCHPDISALCSELFYSGNLVDGVDGEQRKPLVVGFIIILLIIPYKQTTGLAT